MEDREGERGKASEHGMLSRKRGGKGEGREKGQNREETREGERGEGRRSEGSKAIKKKGGRGEIDIRR